MSDEAKRQPVETTSLDAGIAARNAAKASAADEAKKTDADQHKAGAEDVEHGDESGEAEDEGAQNTEGSADSEQGGAKPKPKNRGVGKRIDELTKEKHDALREREYWQREAE